MIHWRDVLREVTFTHTDTEGVVRSIAVERLNAHLDNDNPANVERVRIPVTPEAVAMFRRQGGMEAHRLARVTARDLRAFPITMLHWTGGTHLLVDGTHRYVKASEFGHTHIRTRMVPESVWAPFEVEITSMPGFSVEGMLHYQKHGFSGIA